MAKELIISANVHEKKVAILEDGLVTEFYVERRDENQGVVGNLYKGRVMKVLPGMQSAFVDIGLERDAFLYVSDFTEFMEEEDEIDFRESPEEARASAAQVEDRPRRGDRPRPEIAAAPARKAEPARAEETAERPVRIEDVVEQLAEIADERVIPPPATDEEYEAAAGLPIEEVAEAEVAPVEEIIRERITDEPFETAAADPSPVAAPVSAAEREEDEREEEPTVATEAVSAEAAEGGEEKPKRSRSRKKAADAEPAKPASRSRKKKAAKGEEPPNAEAKEAASATADSAAKTTGRKAAAKSSAKRGSRRRAAETEGGEDAGGQQAAAPESQFERVTDEDLAADMGDILKDAIVQEKIIEQVHTAEYQTGNFQPEPEPEWRVGSFRSKVAGDSSFQRVVDESGEAAASLDQPGATEDEAGEREGSFRHIADALPSEIVDRIQAGGAGEIGDVSGISASGESESTPSDDRSSEEDRDASVRSRGERADFAIRRGGRGRRGRRPPQSDQKGGPPATAVGEDARGGAAVAQEAALEAPKAEEAARPGGSRQPDGRPDGRPEGRPDGRPDRRPDQRRQEPPSRRPERGGPPTISELLHEGQEILVQIAKEPIAKKGARITSHIALPGRLLVYMPTVNHVGVSRKIPNEAERIRLKRIVSSLREREGGTGGFIARTACAGHTEQELHDDMRYLLRTWADVRKKADRVKAPALVHRDLDLVQRILRDQLSDEFSAIRIDSDGEYARIVEFVNRVQPKLVNRVKLYTGNAPIFEKYAVQPEIDKAVRPRVWLKSGGYIVINQTEALVAIDVNTGKFVGKSDKLEDTITRTNLEAAKEIVRQIRLRDLGGIIVIDFIDMEERKNRQRVMTALQAELQSDRAPSKILSINDFGLMAITRKRVKQSLERTLCTPCPYCQGAGMVKSAQTMCFEILEQAKAMSKEAIGNSDVMLRVSPHVAEAFRTAEAAVLEEIEAYFGTPVTIEADPNLHQEQYDFAVV